MTTSSLFENKALWGENKNNIDTQVCFLTEPYWSQKIRLMYFNESFTITRAGPIYQPTDNGNLTICQY